MQNRELWVNVELFGTPRSVPSDAQSQNGRPGVHTVQAALQFRPAYVWNAKSLQPRCEFERVRLIENWYFLKIYFIVSYGLEISEIWGYWTDLDIVVILPFKRWGWHCFRLIWKMGKDGHILPGPGHEDAFAFVKMWWLFQKFHHLDYFDFWRFEKLAKNYGVK